MAQGRAAVVLINQGDEQRLATFPVFPRKSRNKAAIHLPKS